MHQRFLVPELLPGRPRHLVEVRASGVPDDEVSSAPQSFVETLPDQPRLGISLDIEDLELEAR
ncbi:MAG: hypothetical protein K0R61_1257 [Microvirga sp.]|nr:hypothetical protein [Microvirga sp.]